MSFIYYKFKSNIEYDTVMFDGLHMSLEELKDNILLQKKMTKGGNFTLQIINAQTKEEYKDDKALIPKNTSVIVARIPISIQLKKNQEKLAKRNLAYAEPLDKVPQTVDKSSDYKRITQNSNLANMDLSEEDKIKAMMAQATQDFDPNLYPNAKFKQPPPQTYVCFKCHQPGHWIQFCPYIGDSNFENRIKRSTGIPKSFMTIVDGPGHKGALLTNEGKFAVPKIDKIAYQEKKKERPPFLPADNTNAIQSDNSDQNTTLLHDMQAFSKTIKDIPPDLKCGICQNLMQDAVVIPCCGNSFCDACITKTLLDQEDHICPTCHECDILPSTLIPNQKLRKAIDTFLGTRFAAWRTQNSLPSLPTNPLEPYSIYNGMPLAVPGSDKLQNTESGRSSLGNLLKPWEPSKYLTSPFNPSHNPMSQPILAASSYPPSYLVTAAAAYAYPRTSMAPVSVQSLYPTPAYPPQYHLAATYNAPNVLSYSSGGQTYLTPAPPAVIQAPTHSSTKVIGHPVVSASNVITTLSPHKTAERKLTPTPSSNHDLDMHRSKDAEALPKHPDQCVDEMIPRYSSGEAGKIVGKVKGKEKTDAVEGAMRVKRRNSLSPSFKSSKRQPLRRRSSDPALGRITLTVPRMKSVSPLPCSRKPSYTPSSPGTKWSSKSSRRSSRSRDRSILSPRSYRDRRNYSRSRSRSLKHISRDSAPRQAPMYSVSFYNNVLVPAMALAVAKRHQTHTTTTNLLSSPPHMSPRRRHSPLYRTEMSPRREHEIYRSPIYDDRPRRRYDYRTASPGRVNDGPTSYPVNYESRKLRGPLLPTPTQGMSDRLGNEEESYVIYRRREEYPLNGDKSRSEHISNRYNAHRGGDTNYIDSEPRYHHINRKDSVYPNGRRPYDSSGPDGYNRNSFSPRLVPNSHSKAGIESRHRLVDVPSLASHRLSMEESRNYQHDDIKYAQKATHRNYRSQYYYKNTDTLNYNRGEYRRDYSRSPLQDKGNVLSDYKEDSYERQPKSLIKRCQLDPTPAVKSEDSVKARKDYGKKPNVRTRSTSKCRHEPKELPRKEKLQSNKRQKSSSRDHNDKKRKSKILTHNNTNDESISPRRALKIQRKLEKKRIKKEEKMRRKEERKIAKRLLKKNSFTSLKPEATLSVLESDLNLVAHNPCVEPEMLKEEINKDDQQVKPFDDDVNITNSNSNVVDQQVYNAIPTPVLNIDIPTLLKGAEIKENNSLDSAKETEDLKEALEEYTSETNDQHLYKEEDEVCELKIKNSSYPSKWDNVDEVSDAKPDDIGFHQTTNINCDRKNLSTTLISADILRKAEQALTNKPTRPLIQSTSFEDSRKSPTNSTNNKIVEDSYNINKRRRSMEKEGVSKRKRTFVHKDFEKKIKLDTMDKSLNIQGTEKNSPGSLKVKKHSAKDHGIEKSKKHKKKKEKKTKDIRKDKKKKKDHHESKKQSHKQHKAYK